MARGEAAFGGSDPDGVNARDELAALYTHHGAAVRRLCRVLLRNGHEAEDAAQQVFLSAYRSLLSGTVPRHPAAWLATITRNECVLRIQRRMREPLPVGEADETIPDPVMTAAERADLGELWRAIAGLPHKQREALVLREFSGLSYSELATTLAVSEPAIESLLVRARSALRGRLQPAYRSVAGVVPIVAFRDLLARLIGGLPDPTSARGLSALTAGPAVAKVLAGAVLIVAAGGTVAAVEHGSAPGRPTDLRAVTAPAPALRQTPAVQAAARSQSQPPPQRPVLPRAVLAAPVLAQSSHPRPTGEPPAGPTVTPARQAPPDPVATTGSGDPGSVEPAAAGAGGGTAAADPQSGSSEPTSGSGSGDQAPPAGGAVDPAQGSDGSPPDSGGVSESTNDASTDPGDASTGPGDTQPSNQDETLAESGDGASSQSRDPGGGQSHEAGAGNSHPGDGQRSAKPS